MYLSYAVGIIEIRILVPIFTSPNHMCVTFLSYFTGICCIPWYETFFLDEAKVRDVILKAFGIPLPSAPLTKFRSEKLINKIASTIGFLCPFSKCILSIPIVISLEKQIEVELFKISAWNLVVCIYPSEFQSHRNSVAMKSIRIPETNGLDQWCEWWWEAS